MLFYGKKEVIRMYGNYGYPRYSQQPAADERIWVQGQVGADAYLVAPNSFVRLWDSTKPVFYEKRADHTGRPTVDAYEYRRCDQMHVERFMQEPSGMNSIEADLKELRLRVEALERGAENNESEWNEYTEPVPELPEKFSGRS